jgi:flagellar biosynthesis protein FlhB
MSEDRTQPPSKRRREMARRQGQAAHSPELTAAVGWVAAVALLGFFGDDLAVALTVLVRGSLLHPSRFPDDARAVADHVRSLMLGLLWPFAAILGGFAGGGFAAHQLQVRGLWAASQIVPDPSRLWRFSKGPGLSTLFVQSTWSLAKGVIVVAAAACVLVAGWSDLLRQSNLEGPKLAQAAGQIVVRVSWALAGVLLALGLVDYVLRRRRFEAMLRTTPEEQREDQRVMEGDPAARAQRRRAARSMRGDSPELLAGAALLLSGPAGLTLVIAGGPPPRRLSIRTVAKGGIGLKLRRFAEANGIPLVDDASLAQRLARRPASGSAIGAELIAELAAIWPGSSGAASV